MSTSKFTQEDEYIMQGFKDGYFLADHYEHLLNFFMKINKYESAYLEGIKLGSQQYEKDIGVISKESKKERRDILKRIFSRNKTQDEHER